MTSSEAHPPEDKPTGRAAPAATWEEALYTLLSTAPSLATAASRRMVSVFLPPALRPLAPAATLPRDEFVAALVALCAERPENTETLVAVMQSLDGDAQHIRQLRMLCDQRLAQTRFPEADFDLLRTLVEAVPVEEVQEIAASSMDLLPAPLPEHCTDAWSILLHLLRRNVPMHGLPPFMSFLEHLAASASTDGGESLRSWNDELAQRSGRIAPLEECRAKAQSSAIRAVADHERRLMFALMPDGLEDDVYVLGLWRTDSSSHPPALRDSGMRLRREEIAREVGKRLATALHTAIGRRPKLTVEFWLPMALVNEPVWTWCRTLEKLAEPTDDAYTVVVRSLDRSQSPEWTTSLQQHWVVTAESADREELADTTLRIPPTTARTSCVVLSEPPSFRQGKRELMEALEGGVPAILWDRHDCSSSFLRRARDVVATCSLEELPLRIGKLQREAGRPDAQVILLWDTPDHTLPTLSPLVTPDEAAAQ
ncbi:effector-associated domain 2-containing protein [Streptomyces phaeochromogenes]|uniref:VMAP-C domain-containing protein n=1 Tax=Streptomyces phaeochromogenes TaxID=1923 RepID=UPI003870295A